MNVNIPPDSQAWLFAAHPRDEGALWSFRYQPPCEVGEELVFRFDGEPVGRASVHLILEPGDHDGPCHNGMRYLSGWKVVWRWADFEDLRGTDEARWMMAAEKISYSMHWALREAVKHPDGLVEAGDNGVLKALLRRTLASQTRAGIVINDAGRWAVDHARIDPKTQPSGVSDADFRRYLETRGG